MLKKILSWSALFLCGIVIGLPSGIYLVQGFIRPEKMAGMLSEEYTVDSFAKMQFKYARGQDAREALLAAIAIHKQIQSEIPKQGRAEKETLGWCFAELSLLDESQGNSESAKNYMAQAEEMLKQAGLKDISEERIRDVLKKGASAVSPGGRS